MNHSDMFWRFARSVTVTAAVVLASACDGNVLAPFAEAPVVEVLSARAAAGTMVPVRLENPGNGSWSYNLCSDAMLERRVGAAWVPAPPPLLSCAAVLHTLASRASTESAVYVPLGYEAGTYRVAVEFRHDAMGSARAVSGAFVVE